MKFIKINTLTPTNSTTWINLSTVSKITAQMLEENARMEFFFINEDSAIYYMKASECRDIIEIFERS